MRLPARLLLSLATFLPGHAVLAGDWYVKLGAQGVSEPSYEGSSERKIGVSPTISIGREGNTQAFSSRNDSPSFGIVETETVRAGVAGRLVWGRDSDTSDDLEGLSDVKFGAEVGGFVDVYPTDYLRVRGELRQGVRSHDGLVADVAADAFTDIAPDLQVSGGPRARYATSGYSRAYYGVNAAESAASGLDQYDPGAGWQSVGAGAAITWNATARLQASAFAEYKRLVGPAADSSLVQERGTPNQVIFGVGASYKFGVQID